MVAKDRVGVVTKYAAYNWSETYRHQGAYLDALNAVIRTRRGRQPGER
ncbi:MAG: hypothetical protein U0531_11070 [Dehalococcoidia bacterium]